MQKRSNFPIIFIVLGVLLIAGSLGILLLSRPPGEQAAQNSAANQGVFPAVPRVSLSEAKDAFDSGEAIFVDVRRSDAYAEAHISGALSIPEQELADRMEELDPDQWIIPY